MQRLQGKVAVITGGNSGIGLASACLFAKEGAQVIITARRQEVLDEAVRHIGHGAIGIKGDVASLEHHVEVAEQVRERFGALDVYMANAGVITLTPSHQVTPAEFDAQFNINTRGVFFGVQSIIPLLRDGASIILTSSLAATKVLDGHAVYAGSKAAIAAFARNWALELRARRIRVNVLSPGPVDTAIIGKLGVSEADRPGFEQMMADMIPAGRLGEADELAQAALYLASSDSSFVNGIELHVDGGMSLV
ncbi:SDR family oxidoreductase [Pseudomonas sp. NFX98]|uniref:SDR family oxidoreductase n=1 Tax=Pseudomonas sp. NFX98 TaxID=3399122 RepID=UPI0039FD55CD